jgi:hypothetical protein
VWQSAQNANQVIFPCDLPGCPTRYSDALLATVVTAPLWLRPSVAVEMSSLPRYEIDHLIKEKLVKVAWRPNKTGKLHPLIYGPSLWNYLDSLAEPAVGQQQAGEGQ